MVKKEHYIPRAAVLRRFSNTHTSDDYQNKLLVYDVGKNYVRSSCVINEAHKESLYEHETIPRNFLENILAEIDDKFVDYFDKLITLCMNPRNDNALILHGSDEKSNLRFFLAIQRVRTLKTRYEANGFILPHEISPQDVFIWNFFGKDSISGEPWLLHYYNELENHYAVFERNETMTPFMLCDQPIEYFRKTDEDAFCVRFAISPWLNILLINPKSLFHQEQSQFRNRIHVIENGNDDFICFWNRECVEEAYKFVYFTPGYEFDFDASSTNFLKLKPAPSC